MIGIEIQLSNLKLPADLALTKQMGTSEGADLRLVPQHPEVYEPCEDSFALVDALLADQDLLRLVKPTLCLEIGCGSGYVLASLALLLESLGQGGIQYLATDINSHAAAVAMETLRAHSVEVDIVLTSLCGSLLDRLAGRVDVLVFNPPYVPTSSEEVGVPGITASWAGGSRGREVLDRLLPDIDKLLSINGLFYLVVLAANDPEDICRYLSRQGFASRKLLERRTEEELLFIFKFWRQ